MANKKSEQIKEWIIVVMMLVMLAMVTLPLFDVKEDWMRWTYAAAAGITLIVRFTQRYDGNNLRIKRLYRMNIIAAVMFCVSAGLTFYHTGTDSIALLMAGAVLQIYATTVTGRLEAQEQNGKKQKKQNNI
ncbi:MAG: hypothetical protein KBT13_11150 [Bacteroidales bacterium]|nr:hypothetical protein [Candidatus Sodaliphilus limicaballi]